MDMQADVSRMNLDSLFRPASVAIVGATESFEKLGGRVLTSLIGNGFSGEIYPINPGRERVQGLAAYPSIETTPQAPELVILAVGAKDVEDQTERACRAGARAVVVFASGFAELSDEGAAMQARLSEIVKRHGVRLLGPNCLGIMSGSGGVVATSTVTMKDRVLTPGGLAFVSQSGAVATFWLMDVLNRGMGVSAWVSTGNEADVGLSEVIDYLVDDPATRVIGVYVEGFRDGPTLRAALAKAARQRKPVIVLKSGRSAAGAEATASHTGALAGEDEVCSALFAQYGVSQVDSLREMVDLSKVFLTQTPTTGRRTCVISLSGGAGALMTDAASKYGYEMPPLPEDLAVRLQARFPDYIQVRNPIDLSTEIISDPQLFTISVEEVMKSGAFDVILTFMAGRTPRLVEEARRASIELLPGWTGSHASVWQATTLELPGELERGGVLVYDEIPEAVRALSQSRRTAEVWDAPPIGDAPKVWDGTESTLLTEQASKAYLAARTVLAIPAGVTLTSANDTQALPHGGRYAVKLQSPDLPHKSGHGAIEIGVAAGDVTVVVERMLAMARTGALPNEGVLVEAMEDIEAEFLVGLRHDPVLGPFLVIGRGGVSVEVDPDVARAFLPLDAPAIASMLRSLRSRKLLDGFRGKPPVPVEALSRTVANLAALFGDSDELAEIEINPLCVCRGDRIVAIDASIRLRGSA